MKITLELEIKSAEHGTQTEATVRVRSSLAGTDDKIHYGAVVIFPRGEPYAAQGALEDAIRHFRAEAEQELAIKP